MCFKPKKGYIMPNKNKKSGVAAIKLNFDSEANITLRNSRKGGFTVPKDVSSDDMLFTANLISPFAARFAACVASLGLTAFKGIASADTLPLPPCENVYDVAVCNGYCTPADFELRKGDLYEAPRFKAIAKFREPRMTLKAFKSYAEYDKSRRFKFANITPKDAATLKALIKAGYTGFADCKVRETRVCAIGIKPYVPAVKTDEKLTVKTETGKGKGKKA